MPIWIGSRRLAVVPAITTGAGTAPADFQAQVQRRIFYDPDPTANIDRSLRKYVFSASYGRAILEAEVLAPVTVKWEHPGPGSDPGTTTANAIAAAVPSVAAYDYVMVVFPPGIGDAPAHATYGGGRQASCYVHLDDPVGVWAMELLHMVTEFGDLYIDPGHPLPNRPLTPGNLDEMDTAGAMHPSTYTKLSMGWLDAASVKVVDPQQGSSEHLLHPLALLQPAPPGRATALKIPFQDRPNHYYLVEAREWLDEYDRNTHAIGLAEGIPLEGIAIYDVDEAVSPPLWLKVQGLQAGGFYEDLDQHFRIDVTSRIAGGGFSTSVKPLPEPVRCAEIRHEIATLMTEIRDLQVELRNAATGEKARIIAEIGALRAQAAGLRAEANGLHCNL